MAEECVRCGISGNEVRLFDSVYNGRMSKICERCSIIENIPVIKKPAASQLKDSEKGTGVYERMKRLAGIKDRRKESTFFIEDRLNELNQKPELELPEKEKLNLIEHYHWVIMKNRRRKGLSQEKLAEALGESSLAIKMIEKAKLPENAETLIRKLEQFFQIKLRKMTELEKIMKEKQMKKTQKPVLLDKEGKELEIIPEPEIKMSRMDEEPEIEIIDAKEPDNEDYEIKRSPELHCRVEVKKESKTPLLDDLEVVECRVETQTKPEKVKMEVETQDKKEQDKKPAVFDVKKADLSGITIADLKEMHKRKIEATKQEKIEEKKRIEERQRLIEARKEELRLKKEKESQKIDEILGGAELLDDLEEDNSFEKREEFDDELI